MLYHLTKRPSGSTIAKKPLFSSGFFVTLRKLFLSFLVHSLRLAPLTILLELDLALNKFFVFGRPIVYALAFGAGQFYEAVLRHRFLKNTSRAKPAVAERL